MVEIDVSVITDALGDFAQFVLCTVATGGTLACDKEQPVDLDAFSLWYESASALGALQVRALPERVPQGNPDYRMA